jgi:hypothetical protein
MNTTEKIVMQTKIMASIYQYAWQNFKGDAGLAILELELQGFFDELKKLEEQE